MSPGKTLQSLLLAICFAIIHLPIISAQTANPTNLTTLPTDNTPLQPVLSYKQSNGTNMFLSDTNIGLNVSNSDQTDTIVLENAITGNLLWTTPFSYSNLTSGDIAYISCDQSAYNNSNIGIRQTITGAIQKINDSSTRVKRTNGAVILYSIYSNWCNFTAPSGFSYDPLFVLPDPVISKRLEDSLRTQMQSEAQIALKPPGQQNNTQPTENDDSALGPSPTTTVAMIILYSITGIITLLFLIIIITGSIRAHRNPERYGPGAFLGGSRQSRARGIARAMLETLPIVKFGERDQDKTDGSRQGDVELGVAGNQPVQGSTDPTVPGQEVTDDTPRSSSQHATVADDGSSHAVQHESPPPEAVKDVSPEGQAEAGLACSVCTDDFVKGQDTRVLPCNHKFHPECIDPWLLNVSGTCPLCRVDLRPPETENPESEGMDGNASELGASDNAQPHERLRIRNFLSRAARGSPQQRVEALRDLRAANQASEENSVDAMPRARTRVGNRLSRLLGRNSTFEPPSEVDLSGENNGVPNREHDGTPAGRS